MADCFIAYISIHLEVHQKNTPPLVFLQLSARSWEISYLIKCYLSYLTCYFKGLFANQKQTTPVVSSKVCPPVCLEQLTKQSYFFFSSCSTTVLKHRALHVRHNQLPLSREEEEARVINCEATFRNRFEDLRRRFDLVVFSFRLILYRLPQKVKAIQVMCGAHHKSGF